MHESEKWKGSCSVVPNSWWPQGLQPARILRPWDFPGKSTGVGCHCLLWAKTHFFQISNVSERRANYDILATVSILASLYVTIMYLFNQLSLQLIYFIGIIHDWTLSFTVWSSFEMKHWVCRRLSHSSCKIVSNRKYLISWDEKSIEENTQEMQIKNFNIQLLI